jgi:hypothetical protein
LGPGGAFRILFFSDPNLPDPGLYAGYTHHADYAEDPDNGFVTGALVICCINPPNSLSVVLASDGEFAFDPFQYGGDTGDGIQFQGAVVIPEPGSLTLVAAGVIALLIRRRRSS